MKVVICGSGLVGSYLYRLLSRAGYEHLTIFEKYPSHQTTCGIHPCAWGTSIGFNELIEDAGLDPGKYVLQTFHSMVINDLKVQAEAMIIDKPKLIADLQAGAKVLNSLADTNEFNRIIDATGFNRAFLPTTSRDVVSSCVQYRVSSRETWELSIDVSNLGYAWRFPMSRNEYHIGAGSIVMPPHQMPQKLGWLGNTSQICACTGRIRLTAPYFSLPFVYTANDRNIPIWGVGEAIGCVAPSIGEGIIPGLKSARLLLANWDNPQAYQQAILREFSWMEGERKLLDRIVQGKRLGLFDVQILKNSASRFRINLKNNQGLSLLRSASRVG